MDTQGIMFQLPASMCFTLRQYHDVANCSADAAYYRVTDPAFINCYKPRMTDAQIGAIVLFLQAYGELEPCMVPDVLGRGQSKSAGWTYRSICKRLNRISMNFYVNHLSDPGVFWQQ